MKSDLLVFTGPEYAQQCLEPNQSFYVNVPLDEVVKILQSGKALWGQDSGAASLVWNRIETYKGEECYAPIPGRASLVFLYNAPFGMHIRYDLEDRTFIAIDRSITSTCVVHYLCGEPAYFPSGSFLPLDLAIEIVKRFYVDEQRSDKVEWIETTHFRYDLPEAWRELVRNLGKKQNH